MSKGSEKQSKNCVRSVDFSEKRKKNFWTKFFCSERRGGNHFAWGDEWKDSISKSLTSLTRVNAGCNAPPTQLRGHKSWTRSTEEEEEDKKGLINLGNGGEQ